MGQAGRSWELPAWISQAYGSRGNGAFLPRLTAPVEGYLAVVQWDVQIEDELEHVGGLGVLTQPQRRFQPADLSCGSASCKRPRRMAAIPVPCVSNFCPHRSNSFSMSLDSMCPLPLSYSDQQLTKSSRCCGFSGQSSYIQSMPLAHVMTQAMDSHHISSSFTRPQRTMRFCSS